VLASGSAGSCPAATASAARREPTDSQKREAGQTERPAVNHDDLRSVDQW